MCLVRRFWGDSAEQAKFCSTLPDRSVASGIRQTLLSELMRRSRELSRTDQPRSERDSSPRPEWERCGEGRTGGREKLYHVG